MQSRIFHITAEQIDSVINALAEIPAKHSFRPIELLQRVIAMQEVIEKAIDDVKAEVPPVAAAVEAVAESVHELVSPDADADAHSV